MRFILGYFFACVAEWIASIAVLQLVLEDRGTRTAGFAAVALRLPNLLFAPFSAVLERRYAAHDLLRATYALQLVMYSFAGFAATTGLPWVAVVVPSSLALASLAVLRPTTAAMSPSLARTTRELSQTNLWLGAAENASGLVGPLLTAGFVLLLGPSLAIGACAALLCASLLTLALAKGAASNTRTRLSRATPRSRRAAEPVAPEPETQPKRGKRAGSNERAIVDPPRSGPWELVRQGVQALRTRPGATGVLVVGGGHYVLIGALNLLYVVLANDELGLGTAGPGWLATSFGLGAMLSSLLGWRLVARERLGPLLIAGLAVIGVAAVTVGAVPTTGVAVAMLVVMGFSRSLLKLMSKLLLQRSVLPEHTASVFAAKEILNGVALLVGTLVTQILIAIGGADLALYGLGASMLLLLIGAARSLWVADRHADVPVVTISLFRRVPAFAPLLPEAIEQVARSASEVRVHAGDVIIREGDENGDSFYVVGDGAFEVRMEGRHIRTAQRGDSFGEVALLADVPRTATITAAADGLLLAIDRESFLRAVAGNEFARRRVWSVVEQMELPAHVSVTRGENG